MPFLITDKERSHVKYFLADTKLKFGDGVEVTSTEKVKFSAVLGQKKVMIEVCKVNNDIPLLLKLMLS